MKNLIHVKIIGADNKYLYIICECDYKDLEGYLSLKGFSDYKVVEWKIKPTIILKNK